MPRRRIDITSLKPGMTLAPTGNERLPSPYNRKISLVEEDVKRLRMSESGEVLISDSVASTDQVILAISGKSVSGTLLNDPGFIVTVDQFPLDREIPVDLYFDDGDDGIRKLISAGVSLNRVVKEALSSASIEKFIVPESQYKIFDLYQKTIGNALESDGLSGEYKNREEVAKHHHFMDKYFAVNALVLLPGSRPGFDIFSRNNRRETGHLFHSGSTIDENQIGQWIEDDENILILKEDMERYKDYLNKVKSDTKDQKVKAALVRESSKLIITALSGNPRSETLLKNTQHSIADLSTTVIENKTTFYNMMRINNHDYYTFTHSVNVSTMMLALAMEMGITDKQDLADLGLGGMLHDLGKAHVPSEIINKPGKLTNSEFEWVKKHVQLGYEMLKGNEGIPKRAFYPLLQHHEKLTGKGYPNQLEPDEIHVFGRIAAIIDIYDALTTERAYKKAMSPFEALTLISKCKDDYDQDIFSTLVSLIHSQKSS